MDEGVYLYTVGEDVNWYSHKKSMKVSHKLNVELPCDPATLLLGTYPKEMKTGLEEILTLAC